MRIVQCRRALFAAGCALYVAAGAAATHTAVAGGFTRSATAAGARYEKQPREFALPVAIVRDPFVAESPVPADAPVRDRGAAFAPIVGLPVLPPNRAVSGSGPAPAMGVKVRAIVTGSRPLAILEDRDQNVLVRLGDRVDGRRVEAIDAGGVRLAGEVVLRLGP